MWNSYVNVIQCYMIQILLFLLRSVCCFASNTPTYLTWKNISDHKMQGNYVQFLLIVFLFSLCTFFPLLTHSNIHSHENYMVEISFNENEKQVWPFPELKQILSPQQNVDKGCFGKSVTRQIRKLCTGGEKKDCLQMLLLFFNKSIRIYL